MNKQEQIIYLNDQLRIHHQGGIIKGSPIVANLPFKEFSAIFKAVRTFTQFDEGTPAYDEHDFGIIDVLGYRINWKIHYLYRHGKGSSPDPSDPSITERELIMMMAYEY